MAQSQRLAAIPGQQERVADLTGQNRGAAQRAALPAGRAQAPQVVHHTAPDGCLAVAGGEDSHDDHGRNEMGKIGDSLRDALKAAAGHVVQHERQQNRHRKAGHQSIQAENHRVPQNGREIGRVKEILEPLQPHPGTSAHALGDGEVLKGDLHAIHGPVAEHENVESRRKQQQIQRPVAAHQPKRRADFLLSCRVCQHMVFSPFTIFRSARIGRTCRSGTNILPFMVFAEILPPGKSL